MLAEKLRVSLAHLVTETLRSEDFRWWEPSETVNMFSIDAKLTSAALSVYAHVCFVRYTVWDDPSASVRSQTFYRLPAAARRRQPYRHAPSITWALIVRLHASEVVSAYRTCYLEDFEGVVAKPRDSEDGHRLARAGCDSHGIVKLKFWLILLDVLFHVRHQTRLVHVLSELQSIITQVVDDEAISDE